MMNTIYHQAKILIEFCRFSVDEFKPQISYSMTKYFTI